MRQAAEGPAPASSAAAEDGLSDVQGAEFAWQADAAADCDAVQNSRVSCAAPAQSSEGGLSAGEHAIHPGD